MNNPDGPKPACRALAELFDESQLEEIRLVTGEAFADLINQLQTSAAIAFSEIDAAIATADVERLRKSSHRFKGSAATIGARAVAEIAAQIELAAKRGAIDEGVALRESLHEVFEQSRSLLQGMLTPSAA